MKDKIELKIEYAHGGYKLKMYIEGKHIWSITSYDPEPIQDLLIAAQYRISAIKIGEQRGVSKEEITYYSYQNYVTSPTFATLEELKKWEEGEDNAGCAFLLNNWYRPHTARAIDLWCDYYIHSRPNVENLLHKMDMLGDGRIIRM